MNITSLLTTVFALLLCLTIAGCMISLVEIRRLRLRSEDLSERLLLRTSELSQMKERARLLEDSKAAMGEQFQILSQQALETSANGLLKRAEDSFVARERLALERLNQNLKPMSDSLIRFEAQVKGMEEARLKDTGGLKEQIHSLMQASVATRDVTQKLAQALKRGAGVQGRWGEETLRNVLEAAGLTRFDFTEQFSLDTDEGRRRPDVVVHLPGGVFVIDAKVNLTAFLDAMEAVDDEARELALMRHAKALQAHVRDLSQKAYWDQFKEKSPDFVALFIPGDGFLAAALERMPQMMSEAMDKKVIIVTPTTLFALCKAVAYGWRIEDQIKNASQVAELGRELYARLSVMGGHVSGLGQALQGAVKRYNEFIGSLESKVLTQARRFEDLSVHHEGKNIPELEPLDVAPRVLTKPELVTTDTTVLETKRLS
jgi:DNA recombination protein RmuC